MIFAIFNLNFRLQLESGISKIIHKKDIIAAVQRYFIYCALNRTMDNSVYFIPVEIESNHLFEFNERRNQTKKESLAKLSVCSPIEQ